MSPLRAGAAVITGLACCARPPAGCGGDWVKWCSRKSPSSRIATTMIQRRRYHGVACCTGRVLSEDLVGSPGGDEDTVLSSFAMIVPLRLELRPSLRGRACYVPERATRTCKHVTDCCAAPAGAGALRARAATSTRQTLRFVAHPTWPRRRSSCQVPELFPGRALGIRGVG